MHPCICSFPKNDLQLTMNTFNLRHRDIKIKTSKHICHFCLTLGNI